ncbi:MAG: hypothetical protein ACKVXR_06695 [Planctomycetota bacterium]
MRTVPSLVAAVVSLASVAGAQTVFVPPVDISVLRHRHTITPGSPPFTDTVDAVDFPCSAGACNGPGFMASIGTGDTIVVRFEAPPGRRFAVTRAPGGDQVFFASALWQTDGGDATSSFATPTINFENFAGVSPTLGDSLHYVSNQGEAVYSHNVYSVNGDFSFTALDVRFTVGHALAPAPRTYHAVDSSALPSFGSQHRVSGTASDTTVMSIEPIPGTGFCSGDGTQSPCPCGNSGSPGRGCENSSTTGGALLSAAGSSNPDTMVLNVDGEEPTALTIFVQGTQAIAPVAYGDGLRCVHGELKRLYTKTASGGSSSAPTGGELSITARSAQLGHTIAPGSTRYYMTYYRDGDAGFCPSPTGSTFNGSNGWTILW